VPSSEVLGEHCIAVVLLCRPIWDKLTKMKQQICNTSPFQKNADVRRVGLGKTVFFISNESITKLLIRKKLLKVIENL
jgi:hypothetical protein